MYNSCLQGLKIPKLWRRAKVVAILMPGKCPSDPKSYHPISLLCYSFKLFGRMLLNCFTPVLESSLIPEQAGCLPGKSCTKQTLNLVQYIEEASKPKKSPVSYLWALTAAFDTVKIRRLLMKLHEITNTN
ncbi:unnamed protein product [Arctia plantaginis]|uniref:Reverse transcriptase domain-containing protein n=1 Tax=Arctia plantaginis TaxID=874455 RepID=A0A8S1A2R4_ARCPL|nr:unnamed protein product [Arctia plantaginis]